MRFFNNKRGNWVDIFEYLVGSLSFAATILIVMLLLNSFNTNLNTVASSNEAINDSVALARSQQMVTDFPKTDVILPVLYIFFLGFSVWSSRKIPSSHLFMWLVPIMLIIITLFSMGIEVFWQEFSTHTSLSGFVSSFRITNFMLSNAKYFALFYSILVGVSLYAKKE